MKVKNYMLNLYEIKYENDDNNLKYEGNFKQIDEYLVENEFIEL
jgi:hypothetical protein